MNRLKREIAQAAVGPAETVGPDKAAGRYVFPDSFIGFSGHFPEYPVLPAYVQILMALVLMEEWKGPALRLDSVEKAKFHIELHPGQEITVQCREYEARGRKTAEINLTTGEGLAAVFHITFHRSEDA